MFETTWELPTAPGWLGWGSLSIIPILFLIYYLFFKLKIQEKEFVEVGYIKNQGLSTHLIAGVIGSVLFPYLFSNLISYLLVILCTIIYEIYKYKTEAIKPYGTQFVWFWDTTFDMTCVWFISYLIIYLR